MNSSHHTKKIEEEKTPLNCYFPYYVSESKMILSLLNVLLRIKVNCQTLC